MSIPEDISSARNPAKPRVASGTGLVFHPSRVRARWREEEQMAKFLAGVLSVIAVGVLLIAYGLLSPRAAAYNDFGPGARPWLAGEQFPLADDPYARYGDIDRYGRYMPAAPYGYLNYPAASPAPVVRAVPTVVTASAPQRVVTRTVEGRKRDWGKTALIIGGSTAAGAGVGGIFGGKKGALIGAAIGGGASTIFESVKK
jgi:hypothetical protein